MVTVAGPNAAATAGSRSNITPSPTVSTLATGRAGAVVVLGAGAAVVAAVGGVVVVVVAGSVVAVDEQAPNTTAMLVARRPDRMAAQPMTGAARPVPTPSSSARSSWYSCSTLTAHTSCVVPLTMFSTASIAVYIEWS